MDTYEAIYYEDALTHYGILGMKLGRRKAAVSTKVSRSDRKYNKQIEKAKKLKSRNKGTYDDKEWSVRKNAKERIKLSVNSVTHPIHTIKAVVKQDIDQAKNKKLSNVEKAKKTLQRTQLGVRNKNDLRDPNRKARRKKRNAL